MKLIYICGPYRSSDPWQREQNIRDAETLAYTVAKLGGFPVCPHANTRPYFEGVQDAKFWLEGTTQLLARCDALITFGFWMESLGASTEVEYARKHNLPRFYDSRIQHLEEWLRLSESREKDGVENALEGDQH